MSSEKHDITPVPNPLGDMAINPAEKKEVTSSTAHLEDLPVDAIVNGKWEDLRADAIAAEEAERNLSIRESFRLYPKAVLWSLGISLCIIMEGYDLGSKSILLGNLVGVNEYRKKYGYWTGEANGYQLTPAWQSAIGQASTIGCFIGIIIASYAQDRWGYRRTLQIGLVALTGFIFIVFFSPNIETLFVGQLLCGLPWGAFSSSAVSYASDVTPVSLRGYLTTYINLCWVIGQFLAAGVMVAVQDRTDQWAYRIPFAIQWVWPIPLFIIVTLAPESPWYLVRQNKLAEAEHSVKRLSRRDVKVNPANTVAMMVRTNQFEIDNHVGSSFLDCFKGVDLRRTEIVCLAWPAQILAGSSFANQPTYFFQQAGLSSDASFSLGLGVTALAFVGTCISWFVMTAFGRRPIFITGVAILTLLLFLIGGISFPAEEAAGARWGQAALVMCWVFVFDLTIAPLAYCIVGETSSTRLRAKTVGLSRNLYNIISVTSSVLNTYQMNPTAWDWKGKAGFFWGAFSSMILIWAYFRLPECKGRSFRELDILFERRIPARKFKETIVDEEDES